MSSSKVPFEVKRVNEELNKQLLQSFQGEMRGFLEVGPKKWFLPSLYELEGPEFYNFKVRPDDVWIVTFPRSGTTVMQEMTWLLANNLDYKKAKEITLQYRFSFLDILVHNELKEEVLKKRVMNTEERKYAGKFGETIIHELDNATGRRFIKTHLPLSLLPPDLLTCGAKVIYVARNPKDVSTSFYHLCKLIEYMKFVDDFKSFWNYFEYNMVYWGPFWEHINEGWINRTNKNLLFLFYEDLIQDTPGAIRNVASYLEKHVTSEEVDSLANHLNIENFRKNTSVNFEVIRNVGLWKEGAPGFIRKGKTGSWREEFDEETNERANKWIKENLNRFNIDFPQNCQLDN